MQHSQFQFFEGDIQNKVYKVIPEATAVSPGCRLSSIMHKNRLKLPIFKLILMDLLKF